MGYDLTYATATHIMAVLAFYDGEWVTSQKMADSIQTNPGLVRRLLSQLSAAGLVVTRSGPQGGARLAKSMQSINLRDVYDAVMQQSVLKTSTREPNQTCRVSRGIGNALEGVFSGAENAMRNQLKKTTLQEVMKKI